MIRSIVKPNLKSKISTNSLLYSYIKRSSLKRIERLKRMFSSLDEFSARFHRQFVWLSLTNVRMSKHLEISRDEGWWKRERETSGVYSESKKRNLELHLSIVSALRRLPRRQGCHSLSLSLSLSHSLFLLFPFLSHILHVNYCCA